ncbi:hypothetical protein [Planctobacterium marinum]|uniref:hypothetical protein n=1 Tax=Planctobacterium marinum TaxID=1631968 RepID=UPI001E3E8656|nr:hypothetical protein [Planctobacterium marinum]MCC2606802.1 hypothetical protein [Planctobacterium marinum]
MLDGKKKAGRRFVDLERGRLICRVIRLSNSNDIKLSKLAVDICMYLISLGNRKIVQSVFYKDLHSLAKKVAEYSGRETVPTKGAMSSALSKISAAGLYRYSIDVPNKKAKFGEHRGIKLTLCDDTEKDS